MSISMGVILFNKWILAYSGFKYPIALTLWHMVFCTTIATILMRVFKVTKRLKMPRKEYVSRVLPIGAFYAASLWLSNSAYLHLSVSFIQMTKALMPGLVYFVGIIFRTEKYHGLTTLNMFIIAIGVAIAAYGEINFIWIGVIEQFSALIFEATRLCLVQILIKNKGYAMNPIQSLYYVSPACGIFLLVPFLTVELPEITANAGLVIDWKVLILNASCAFLLNLAVFLLIGKTSALTMNVAGVIKDWILIFISSMLFDAPISATQLWGYLLAFAAVCYYNYTKFKEREVASAADAGAGDGGKEMQQKTAAA